MLSIMSVVSFRSGSSCSKGGWRYPLNNSIGLASVYPLDSDMSGEKLYPPRKQPRSGV